MEKQKLNEFIKLLEQYRSFSGKHHIGAFDDFLEVMICFFSPTIRIEKDRFKKEELQVLTKMIYHIILTQNYMLNQGGRKWYDFFGNFYEQFASHFTRKDKGQFFTPEEIVDFSTMVVVDKESENLAINDPTCGSGRMLIASHAYNPKNFHFGQDIDRTCCMMSAINMVMHGCRGEIVWQNSLDYNSFFKAWKINSPFARDMMNNPIPTIIEIEKEDSILYQANQKRLKEIEIEKEEKERQERLKIMPLDLFGEQDFK